MESAQFKNIASSAPSLNSKSSEVDYHSSIYEFSSAVDLEVVNRFGGSPPGPSAKPKSKPFTFLYNPANTAECEKSEDLKLPEVSYHNSTNKSNSMAFKSRRSLRPVLIPRQTLAASKRRKRNAKKPNIPEYEKHTEALVDDEKSNLLIDDPLDTPRIVSNKVAGETVNEISALQKNPELEETTITLNPVYERDFLLHSS